MAVNLDAVIIGTCAPLRFEALLVAMIFREPRPMGDRLRCCGT